MKIFTVVVGIIFGVNCVIAQNSGDVNKVKQAKILYFNQQLELNQVEAKKFWPVYNDYQSRRSRLSQERKNIMQFYLENNGNMTDKEISETLNRYIEIEKELTILLEKYNEQFKSFLPDKKVLKIYLVEVQFKNMLLKQLRTGKQEMKLRK